MKKNKNMKTKTSKLFDEILNEISPLEQAKSDAKMIIAAKIDEAMRAKGWKSKDLLKAVGKENPSIITKWLSGTHNFTLETLVEIGSALDIQLLNVEEKNDVEVRYHVIVSQRAEPNPEPDYYNNIIGAEFNFKYENLFSK